MPLFELTFNYTQRCRAKKTIEASTRREAEEMAEEISSEDLVMVPVDGELSMEDIILVKKLQKRPV